MPYYRKKKGSDTWHWCKNCREYPTTDYDEEWHMGKERPKSGELCDQCLGKERNGECQT